MDLIDITATPDGTVTKTSTDELSGKLVKQVAQDIEANVRFATDLRNDPDIWRQGVKQGFAHAAHIPTSVQLVLMSNGVDIYRAPAREIVAAMKRLGYEYLLTTTKRV